MERARKQLALGPWAARRERTHSGHPAVAAQPRATAARLAREARCGRSGRFHRMPGRLRHPRVRVRLIAGQPAASGQDAQKSEVVFVRGMLGKKPRDFLFLKFRSRHGREAGWPEG